MSGFRPGDMCFSLLHSVLLMGSSLLIKRSRTNSKRVVIGLQAYSIFGETPRLIIFRDLHLG